MSTQDPCTIRITLAAADEELFNALCFKHKLVPSWEDKTTEGKLKVLWLYSADYGELDRIMDIAKDEDSPPFKYNATSGDDYLPYAGISVGNCEIFIPVSTDEIPVLEVFKESHFTYDKLAEIELYYELEKEFQVYTKLLV